MGALIIELTGNVVQTNFDVYKERLIGRIRSAGHSFESDADFARAEAHVTFFK